MKPEISLMHSSSITETTSPIGEAADFAGVADPKVALLKEIVEAIHEALAPYHYGRPKRTAYEVMDLYEKHHLTESS